MKATELQKQLADKMAKHIANITSGNDIDSPSHSSYNETEALNIVSSIYESNSEDIIGIEDYCEAVADKVVDAFTAALVAIRKFK